MLAAQTTAGLPPIICTLLLLATAIGFVIGLAEALGLFSLGVSTGRFTSLVVAVILLVVYVVLC